MDQQYLLTLAREYIELVEMHTSSYEEWHAVDSQRVNLHHDLCQIMDVSRGEDMYRICRNLVHEARAIGDFEYDEPD